MSTVKEPKAATATQPILIGYEVQLAEHEGPPVLIVPPPR